MKKIFLFFVISIFLLFFYIGNQNTKRTIGINYEVFEYKIPIYLKISDFINRHYNYKYLVKEINKNENKEEEIVINTAKWIKKNIKKISIQEGIDIVDHHPITIVERRLGIDEQFSDILSVLLVYSNIESFFKIFNLDFSAAHSLTFFKINDYWSIIDPYYGIFFINPEGDFIKIDNLQNNNWEIADLNLKIVDHSNYLNIYKNKFENFDDVKIFYNKIFNNLPTTSDIDQSSIYDLGGRSYIQDPLGRIRFELRKLNIKITKKLSLIKF